MFEKNFRLSLRACPTCFCPVCGEGVCTYRHPQLNHANIWQGYCEIVQTLSNITSSNGTNANQAFIECVDEWQVVENLQDLNHEPDLPYHLIEGHELQGGIEQDDGYLYLGGVNEGQGLGTWKLIY